MVICNLPCLSEELVVNLEKRFIQIGLRFGKACCPFEVLIEALVVFLNPDLGTLEPAVVHLNVNGC